MLLLEEGRRTTHVDATSGTWQTDLIRQFVCFNWVVFSFNELLQ